MRCALLVAVLLAPSVVVAAELADAPADRVYVDGCERGARAVALACTLAVPAGFRGGGAVDVGADEVVP